jgi:hypothetical protein
VSKLLIDEYPLLVLPSLAKLLGLHEAIILQQIHYWVEINRKADKNFKDGFYWTYNSYENWQKQFDFVSIRTIKAAIANLESKGVLVSGIFNKAKFDRTKWYRVDQERLRELKRLGKGNSCTMQDTDSALTIPEINQSPFESLPSHDLGMLTAMAQATNPRRTKTGKELKPQNKHPLRMVKARSR